MPAGDCLIGRRKYFLFTESGHLTSEHLNLIANPALARLLDSAKLTDGESIHFFEDAVSAYIIGSTLDRLNEAIDKLVVLAAAIQGPEEGQDNLQLPIQFRPLLPLIRKWSISDDEDRELFLGEQPLSVLLRFVEQVQPFLTSINSYLDSFGNRELPKEAIALSRLAECAAEAQLLIGD
jgi:hypothetical protein